MITDNEITYAYEVSVIIVTYNSDFDKTKATIQSILTQKGISLEIIVVDDGSSNNNMDLLDIFFKDHMFKNYKLVANKINRGTVSNFISGLKVSQGKYVKSISPGDYLYGFNTLRRWVDFLEEKKVKWSFSEAIYYQQIDGHLTPVSVTAHPQLISPYLKEQQTKSRWNYVALRDNALGAAILGEKQVILEYCKKILTHGIVYAEDTIFGLMMFDGNVGGYYAYYTMLYEYGTGISTNGNSVWEQRIEADWSKAEQIMELSPHLDDFQKLVIKAIKRRKGNFLSKLLVGGKLYHWCCVHFNPRKTINFLPEQD